MLCRRGHGDVSDSIHLFTGLDPLRNSILVQFSNFGVSITAKFYSDETI